MNFYSVFSGKLSPRWASLFALLNISGGLSKDWKPPHTQNLLLRLCLSLNCSSTAFGLFYFLPMNLGQELEAFQVLESKSKACPRWAVALDSPVTVPKDDSHVSVCSCFDGAEHEQVPPGDPRADLLCAAGCHSLSKASRGLERGFVGDHFSPCTPPQHPGSELNASAGNPLAARSGNDALSKGSPDGYSL